MALNSDVDTSYLGSTHEIYFLNGSLHYLQGGEDVTQLRDGTLDYEDVIEYALSESMLTKKVVVSFLSGVI